MKCEQEFKDHCAKFQIVSGSHDYSIARAFWKHAMEVAFEKVKQVAQPKEKK